MKIKNIIILAIIALVLFGYSAEAKKKSAKVSLPVLKTKIEGFSERIIEIDQEAIEFELNASETKVRFKKVANFPYNYTPRFDKVFIYSVGDNNGYADVSINTYSYMLTDALYELTKLMTKPVGSTVEVTMPLYAFVTPKELKKAKTQGMAINEVIVGNQDDYNQLLDFIMQLKKLSLNNEEEKIAKLACFDYDFPDNLDWDGAESYKDGFTLPYSVDILKKLSREALEKGYMVLSKENKNNFIEYFKLYYNESYQCYVLTHKETIIRYTGGWNGRGSEENVFFAKVNGKFRIVRVDFANYL